MNDRAPKTVDEAIALPVSVGISPLLAGGPLPPPVEGDDVIAFVDDAGNAWDVVFEGGEWKKRRV